MLCFITRFLLDFLSALSRRCDALCNDPPSDSVHVNHIASAHLAPFNVASRKPGGKSGFFWSDERRRQRLTGQSVELLAG